MSQVIGKEACPKCGSSDNVAVYTDGHRHCFSHDCDYHTFADDGEKKLTQEFKELKADKNMIQLPLKSQPGIPHRGLDASTVNFYKVTVAQNPESQLEAVFPKFDEEGQHVANQVRKKEKQFRTEGPVMDSCLFGQNLFPSGGRSITITEGFYDAMAAFQLTGSRYPNVGVMSASSAKKEIVTNFEYVNSFTKIILAFDSDEPGQKAAKEVAQLFDPGKVCILSFRRHKDANEYLIEGKVKEYIDEWHRAPPYMPDGLQLGNDPKLLDEIVNYKEPHSIPYPWVGVNKKTYGIRLSELTLIKADTGSGKTTFCKEIEYKLLTDPELIEKGYGVGFLHLEETKRDVALGLMSVHKSKPYHLPDTPKTAEELTEVFNEVINTDRVVIWDHFGSNDIDVVLAKVRHMVALGCRYIVIDHLSIIVSDQSGDERKQLDEISTKLKTMTMNLNIACICVIHINRQGQVRGSAGPEQVSNNIFSLERDKKDPNEWRRNVTRLVIEKCRLTGRTGPASWIYYNPITGRLEELEQEMIDEYEQGGSGAGHEFGSM